MRSDAALKLALVATALVLAFSPASVLASGFQLMEQNGSGLGNAYSGQAAGVKDASAIYFNPAALTGLAHDPELDFLYGAAADGVVTIDPETGGSRALVPTLLVALAFDGESGLLYGVEADANGARLLSIDPADGELQLLADLAEHGELSALAFDAEGRKLYAADASEGELVVVDAITGEKKEIHVIEQGKCISCGACFDACTRDAVRYSKKTVGRETGHGADVDH